jgi:hypothetical protein
MTQPVLIRNTPTDCWLAYNLGLQRYFPASFFKRPAIAKFTKLSQLISKEQVDAYDYIIYWFGLWENNRQPTIKQLTNLELVIRYKSSIV